MSGTEPGGRATSGDPALGRPLGGSTDVWERAEAALELEVQLWTVRTALETRTRLVPGGLLAFLGRC